MGKMKTQFDLVSSDDERVLGSAVIVGQEPKFTPYLTLKLHTKNDSTDPFHYAWVKDKDLERFAVNILKALKSKKLKQ